MIRALWIALLLALAIVAGGAQLDRASRRSPEAARYGPPPFRSFALEDLPAQATVRGEPGEAVLAARRLVRNRPVPAEHLALLGVAHALSGEPGEAVAAIRQAGRRGWRDAAAQGAMLEMALDAGDGDEAARRLVALWTLRDDPALLAGPSARVVADPAACAAFARWLAADRRLRARFSGQAGAMGLDAPCLGLYAG